MNQARLWATRCIMWEMVLCRVRSAHTSKMATATMMARTTRAAAIPGSGVSNVVGSGVASPTDAHHKAPAVGESTLVGT